MEYVLPLQEADTSQRHTTTLHMMLAFILFGIAVCCVGLYWFTSVSPNFKGHAYTPFILFGAVSFVMSIVLVWLTISARSWMKQKGNNVALRIAELVLMLVAAGLFYSIGWKMPALLFGVMSAVLVFALFNERRSSAIPQAFFDEKGILIEGSRGKNLDWAKIERIRLKHTILTISLRDNSIIQRNIAPGTPVAAPDFEQWCATRIEAHAHEQPAAIW